MALSISRLRKPLTAFAPVLKASPAGTSAGLAPMAGGVAPVLKALPGSGGLGDIIGSLANKPPIMKGKAGTLISDLQRMSKK